VFVFFCCVPFVFFFFFFFVESIVCFFIDILNLFTAVVAANAAVFCVYEFEIYCILGFRATGLRL